MESKSAAFRERAHHFRQLANRDPANRLRNELLRAAKAWEELALKIEQKHAATQENTRTNE